MKKDVIILLCSPNINHLNAKRAISSVKSTDLTRAELVIIDNNYDDTFSHPVIMNDMLTYAAKIGKDIIYIDDDVEIHDYDWIDKLYRASTALDADITGCVHTFDDGGTNHEGYYIGVDGMLEPIVGFMHDSEGMKEDAVYVPSLCSAVMLVRNCGNYYIDTKFRKYQHDLDICLQAWQSGRRTACSLGLKIIHHRGYTGEDNPDFQNILTEDTVLFSKKWGAFIPEMTEIPELSRYKSFQYDNTWIRYYNRASQLRHIDTEKATKMFRHIAGHCYDNRRKSGAYYYLYSIEGDTKLLEKCLKFNPCHQGAKKILQETQKVYSPCNQMIDCRMCHLKAQKKIYTVRI